MGRPTGGSVPALVVRLELPARQPAPGGTRTRFAIRGALALTITIAARAHVFTGGACVLVDSQTGDLELVRPLAD